MPACSTEWVPARSVSATQRNHVLTNRERVHPFYCRSVTLCVPQGWSCIYNVAFCILSVTNSDTLRISGQVLLHLCSLDYLNSFSLNSWPFCYQQRVKVPFPRVCRLRVVACSRTPLPTSPICKKEIVSNLRGRDRSIPVPGQSELHSQTLTHKLSPKLCAMLGSQLLSNNRAERPRSGRMALVRVVVQAWLHNQCQNPWKGRSTDSTRADFHIKVKGLLGPPR